MTGNLVRTACIPAKLATVCSGSRCTLRSNLPFFTSGTRGIHGSVRRRGQEDVRACLVTRADHVVRVGVEPGRVAREVAAHDHVDGGGLGIDELPVPGDRDFQGPRNDKAQS